MPFLYYSFQESQNMMQEAGERMKGPIDGEIAMNPSLLDIPLYFLFMNSQNCADLPKMV